MFVRSKWTAEDFVIQGENTFFKFQEKNVSTGGGIPYENP